MDFSKRNPLCNLQQRSGIIELETDLEDEKEKIQLELTKDLSKLIRKQKTIHRETGLQALYLSYGTIDIAGEEFGTMPFYLIPIEIKKIQKDATKVQLLLDWEEKVINPLLHKVVKEKLEMDIDSLEMSSKAAYLGIFNYKKYILLDEISSINEASLSYPLRKLYDFNPNENYLKPQSGNLEEMLVDQADASQRKIIDESFSGRSFCVQGPPGTGKSQTITNMITANLALGKKILFVSEKKAAIDVVFDRLKAKRLHHFVAQVTDSRNDKKDFIRSLEKQWINLKDKNPVNSESKDISAPYARVQLYLDHLFRYRNELDGNLYEALKNRKKIDELPKIKNFPNSKEWSEFQVLWNHLLQSFHLHELRREQVLFLLNIAPSLWSSSEFESKWNLHLNSLKQNTSKVVQVLSDINDLKVSSLEQLMKLCIQARLITGLAYQEKINILKTPSLEKKFKRLSKKFEVLQSDLAQLKIDLQHWIKLPSLQTIEFLETYLNKNSLFSIKGRKANQLLIEHAGNSQIKNLDELFTATRKYYEKEKELIQLRSQLKTEFHILEPEKEIDEIKRILVKSEYQKELFDQLIELPKEKIEALDQLNPIVDRILHSQKVLFKTSYSKLTDLQEKVNLAQDLLTYCLRNKEVFNSNKLPGSNCIEFLAEYQGKWQELNEVIDQLNLQKIIDSSIILKQTTPKTLLKDIKEIVNQRNRNFKSNAESLKTLLKKHFNELEKLLITPAGRLKSAEKELKKELRKGKRLLTHEFSKSKRFKSIRELCEMESKHWVYSMKNIWMMNPLSVSEVLPFEKEQFDLLIIDEASQIPEEDIIPALFRAKQVIIVGDKMQMPPSNFFSGNEVGPSILDTANYRLNNFMLKWHYRSKDPRLIQFSNHAFYDSQLELSPTFGQNQSPLNYHFVENSNYQEGSNPKEAAFIHEFLKKNLEKWKDQIIGIAAFSLTQQKTLEKELKSSEEIEKLLDNEQVFIRNLENLQGDECDVLLISIGYGPDKNGKVSMNMGALSKNGGHNRLNVLITRAREQVHVFSSIPSGSLHLSDNEGLNYLRDYLNYVQNPEEIKNGFEGLKFNSKSETIQLCVQDNEIEKLLSRFAVLSQKGFEVSILDPKNQFLGLA